jgi:hypothetical protein
MNDTCIFAGDPSNSIAFLDVTLVNPRGRPMVISGQSPFIEVNAQKTRLLNVATRIPPTGGTFSSYVQVDNDQSFLLDGLDTALATGSSDYGVLCNASVCNPVIYAPGPFSSNAAVGWLKNLNISMQCAGNGIEGLFSHRTGTEKKDAALSFLQAALSTSSAVANRQIIDQEKFKDGLGKVIDGTVECLNASVWAKAK